MKKEKNPFRKSKHSFLFLLYLFSFFFFSAFVEFHLQIHLIRRMSMADDFLRGQSKWLGRENSARKWKKKKRQEIHVFIEIGFNYQALSLSMALQTANLPHDHLRFGAGRKKSERKTHLRWVCNISLKVNIFFSFSTFLNGASAGGVVESLGC